jgi:hypothetical protein
MHNIKLIFTHHSELGKNNFHALCAVIHSISPDVIFEELSEHDHAVIYKIKASIAVETDAIKMYRHHKVVKQVPVDTFKVDETDIKDLQELHNRVCNLLDINEAVERNDIIKSHRELIIQHGLTFINSDENERLFKQEQDLLRKIVELSNDDRLKQLEYGCTEVTNKREYEIIKNIYRYSEGNQYERAIMLIGSGHRSSILKVIEQFELKEKLKLNWSLYLSK